MTNAHRPEGNLPRHANPTRADRIASAPYNFVPLPEAVVRALRSPVTQSLPSHDIYGHGNATTDPHFAPYCHTGFIDVELTARSPLYVRCGLTKEQFALQERQDRPEQDEQEQEKGIKQKQGQELPFRERVKNRPEFFYTVDKTQPVIPGSSLRGMLRGVLEIASYGKIERVTDKHLFYRSVDNTSLGLEYRERMVGKKRFGNKVEGGFLTREENNDSVGVIAKCEVFRIPRPVAARIGRGRLPNLANEKPDWDQQYHPLWFKRPSKGIVVTDVQPRREVDDHPPSGEWLPGVLVITGASPGKKKEFIFQSNGPSERIAIPRWGSTDERSAGPDTQNLIEQFHDDDQITQWQQQAFPKNEPAKGCRERDGLLRAHPPKSGDPVFFLREGEDEETRGALIFFGRAQMFRLPYQHTPRELVPEALRNEDDVDYAEALFGYVKRKTGAPAEAKQGDKARAYASRVSVGDAHLVADQKDVLASSPIVPPILGTPKPTAFQHYLVQQQSVRDRLTHFDSHGATIRGHKRYWRQGPRTLDDIKLTGQQLQAVKPGSTQHTQFEPVKAGTRFHFRVHFENLSEPELGALCWTLHPLGSDGVEYVHSLGMGKPLGMGAVQLRATLHLTDRPRRYETLFTNDGSWETGEQRSPVDLSDRATLVEYTKEFERHVLDTLGLPHDEATHLYELRRIAMLLRLMEWPGVIPQEPTPSDPMNREGNVRTMRIDLPFAESARDRNEFRSRPVLPDPSAFDRPLSGNKQPSVSLIADRLAEVRNASSGSTNDPTTVTNGVVSQQHRAQTEAPILPRPKLKRGDVLEADVVQVRLKKGELVVSLLPDGSTSLTIANVSRVLMDSDGIVPGKVIRVRVDATDRLTGQVTAVTWKR